MPPSHYHTLGVDADTADEDIRKAYFEIAKKYHPDKNPGDAARKVFESATEAYNVLSDPDKRRAYDRGLKGKKPKEAPIEKKKEKEKVVDSEPLSKDDVRRMDEIKGYRKRMIRVALFKISFYTFIGLCFGYLYSLFFVSPELPFFSRLITPTVFSIIGAVAGGIIFFFWGLDMHFRIDTYLTNIKMRTYFKHLRTFLFSLGLVYLFSLLLPYILRPFHDAITPMTPVLIVSVVLLISVSISSDGEFRKRLKQGRILEILIIFIKNLGLGALGAVMGILLGLLFYLTTKNTLLIGYGGIIGFAFALVIGSIDLSDLHVITQKLQKMLHNTLWLVLLTILFACGLIVGMILK